VWLPDDEAEQALDRQHELGQFLTPDPVADFMASLFRHHPTTIRLLDAGAGAGALTATLVRRYRRELRKPKEITVAAYELDPAVIGRLRATLSACRLECERAGIAFSATVHNSDFIEAVVPMVRTDLFAPEPPRFNAAILNPPYRKIRSESTTRLLLRSAGIETSNLYTGFLALAVRLLSDGAEMVAITPRSFCNGPYFKPFREDFLANMSLRQLHIVESRSAAFNGDDVLQENIIVHAVKSEAHPNSTIISTSSGEPGAPVREHTVPYHDVVSPADPQKFIHLVMDAGQARAKNAMGSPSSTLSDLGLSVSTGRVVDFRAESFLRQQPCPNTVPLIYPCHFGGAWASDANLGRVSS
jgi:adenine-specific DNA-methyltransferase